MFTAIIGINNDLERALSDICCKLLSLDPDLALVFPLILVRQFSIFSFVRYDLQHEGFILRFKDVNRKRAYRLALSLDMG